MAAESETERIHRQMAVQRAALGDKLETLEHKVVGTVQAANDAVRGTIRDARSGVEATVQSVRESVHASVTSVHDTLDVNAQVDRHPWTMFAASVAAGFVAGCILNRASVPAAGYSMASTGRLLAPPPSAQESAPAYGAAWTSNLVHTFAPELQQLKDLAIGAVAGFVRDKVNHSLPEVMRSQVAEMMDSVATRLSGEHEKVPAERA